MKLYDLTSQYAELARLAQDAIDAEDIKAYADTMEGLEGAIGDKMDGCASVFRQLELTESAIKAEEERLAKRRKTIANNRERLRLYMLSCMEAAGITESKGTRFTCKIAANPPRLIVDDETLLPERFIRVKREPDKAAIKLYLSTGGELPGAVHSEQSTSLRIR